MYTAIITIAALLTCVSHEDCIEALSKSFRIFNHTNEQTHDVEVSSGVDAALVRLLSFLLFKESFGEGSDQTDAISSATSLSQLHSQRSSSRISDEVTCACQITEMIYRCSKGALEASFQRVGQDFLHILAKVMAHQLPKYQTSREGDDDQEGIIIPGSVTAPSSADMKSTNVCLKSVTKILCHYARVQSATTSMAHNPKLLSLMISILQHPVGIIPFEACHNTLWVLANMACCNENMKHMASNTRLLDTVIQAANIMQQVPQDNIREGETPRFSSHHALRLQHSAFRCLLNLSWEQENKTLMSQRDDLVDSIVRIVQLKTLPTTGSGSTDASSKAIVTMLLQTRLFALGTLRNIAHTPPQQKLQLCTAQDGMLLKLLCDTVATSSSEDPAIRGKAFAVIFNLVSSQTAEILISHPRILDYLTEAASNPDQGESKPESASTMAFRSLHALDQAVTSRGSSDETRRLMVRRAINQVTLTRRIQGSTKP